MRKSVFIIMALVLVIGLAGCGRKQQALEEMQEPMSIDELSKLSVEGAQPAVVSESTTAAMQQAPVTEQVSSASTIAKPTNQEIQTALKNAGLYAGEVDGKVGPATKKAIEEFQKANNLKPDGKVGAKTWVVLGKYLVMIPAEVSPKKKR